MKFSRPNAGGSSSSSVRSSSARTVAAVGVALVVVAVAAVALAGADNGAKELINDLKLVRICIFC